NPAVPTRLIDEAYSRHYKELTPDELTELRDTVKGIDHFARLKERLLKSQRAREMAKAKEEIIGAIEAHSKGKRPQEIETRPPSRELPRLLPGYLAEHPECASCVRMMDGLEDGGIGWQ